MASVVLTAVGGFIGGPIGAAVGNVIGQEIDRRVLFTPKGREGPRLSDLAVQGSDYGAPLPRHYGTVRSAGVVIWSSGLKETAHRSGGGKKSGGRTTTYSYSCSFAVAFAGREIDGVGRIWADGKLLRGAGGDMLSGGTVRLYRGTERQRPDPLLQAALGIDNAPAHRGLAYAVFQDLELADYANRVPNLSFEIFADGNLTSGKVVEDLIAAVGGTVDAAALNDTVTGYSASRNSDVATVLAGLSVIAPFSALSGAEGLKFAPRQAGGTFAVAQDALLPSGAGRADTGKRRRTGEDTMPGAMTLAANDPARDYQPSVQRALRVRGGGGEAHVDLPASLSATEAKHIAETYLTDMGARRAEGEYRLPLRALLAEPGDLIAIDGGDAGGDWHLRQTAIEGLGVTVQLERRRGGARAPLPADPGVALPQVDIPQGATALEILELLPLGSEPVNEARIWIAAGGASPGWRRAELWLSLDEGVSWQSVGITSTPARMGMVREPPPAANWSIWDETSSFIVDLIDDQGLTNFARASVLAGANLALVGEELIQFTRAEQVDARGWRLSGLLRGRRGTEAAVGGHAAGERFVMIDPAALFPLDLPLAHVGSRLQVKAVGPNDSLPLAPAAEWTLAGRTLRPLSPVHAGARRLANGDLAFHWTRRSRLGFAWLDGADAPLGEEGENYHVRIEAGGTMIERTTAVASLILTVDEQLAAFAAQPSAVTLHITQLSQLVGAGTAAVPTFTDL